MNCNFYTWRCDLCKPLQSWSQIIFNIAIFVTSKLLTTFNICLKACECLHKPISMCLYYRALHFYLQLSRNSLIFLININFKYYCEFIFSIYLVHFIVFIVYFSNFRGSKNRGSMDPVHERESMDLVHILLDLVHGPVVYVLYFPIHCNLSTSLGPFPSQDMFIWSL